MTVPPLTRFLIELLKLKPAQLRRASPDRAAAHFGISRDHAAGYIALQRRWTGADRPAQGKLL